MTPEEHPPPQIVRCKEHKEVLLGLEECSIFTNAGEALGSAQPPGQGVPFRSKSVKQSQESEDIDRALSVAQDMRHLSSDASTSSTPRGATQQKL